MVGLASIDRAAGNPTGYLAWLERARSEDPAAIAPRILLVQHYLLNRSAAKALIIANEARTIAPDHPDVLNALAEAQSASGDKAGAVSSYVLMVKVVPQSRLAYYRLAMAQAANGDPREAIDSLRRALRLKPDYIDAETAMAMLEYQIGRYGDSLRVARQIQRHDPKLAIGYALEGDSLMAQQQFAAAEKAYQNAFARRKSGALATKLHAALNQSGRAKEADAGLLQWLREQPRDAASRLYIADVYVKRQQHPLAIDQYRHVLQQEPENLLALNNLATLYRQQNDPRALEYFERSYKLKPDSAVIADNLGWVLVERGNLPRGLEYLNKAVAQSPDNPDFRYHLAAAMAKAGNRHEARKELERLLATNKPFQSRDDAQKLLKQL